MGDGPKPQGRQDVHVARGRGPWLVRLGEQKPGSGCGLPSGVQTALTVLELLESWVFLSGPWEGRVKPCKQ